MIKKIFLGAVVILAVLIVVAVIVMGFFLGPIVKTGMETVGSKITQVSIKVDVVKVSLWSGSARVEGLVIGNPEGCRTPQAISAGSATVGVSPFSVLSDKIVIRSVHVEVPVITFEGSPFGGNNLKTLMKNVNASTKGGGPASTNATAKMAGNPGKKLEVDDFLITGAKVNFNGVILPLPDIHLTDMGKGGDGITAADLTRRVLDALTTATIKAVGSAATDVGKDVEKAGKNLRKSLGSNASSLTKGLGGLLKKTTN